jgi:hypothetical protein
MADFLDDIITREVPEVPANAPASVLAVGVPCRNSLHFEAYVKMCEAVKALDLPMIFEVDGALDNAADFPPPIETVEAATAWIREQERPVRSAFAGIIEAARAAGDLK